MKKVSTACAGLIAGMFAFSPQAQAASDIVFCNKTGSKVYIAIVHYPDAMKKWMLSAWHTANPGSCKSVGRLRTGLFYYYAEKEGRALHWPAQAYVDKTFCVPNGKVERVMLGGTCAQGERNVGFRGLTPNEGTYTFNLN